MDKDMFPQNLPHEDFECPNCGSGDPHDALVVMDGEVEVDVTCTNVYITPANDTGSGYAFDMETFKEMMIHFAESEYTDLPKDE